MTGWILTKPDGRIGNGPRKNLFNFCMDLEKGADEGPTGI